MREHLGVGCLNVILKLDPSNGGAAWAGKGHQLRETVDLQLLLRPLGKIDIEKSV